MVFRKNFPLSLSRGKAVAANHTQLPKSNPHQKTTQAIGAFPRLKTYMTNVQTAQTSSICCLRSQDLSLKSFLVPLWLEFKGFLSFATAKTARASQDAYLFSTDYSLCYHTFTQESENQSKNQCLINSARQTSSASNKKLSIIDFFFLPENDGLQQLIFQSATEENVLPCFSSFHPYFKMQ